MLKAVDRAINDDDFAGNQWSYLHTMDWKLDVSSQPISRLRNLSAPLFHFQWSGSLDFGLSHPSSQRSMWVLCCRAANLLADGSAKDTAYSRTALFTKSWLTHGRNAFLWLCCWSVSKGVFNKRSSCFGIVHRKSDFGRSITWCGNEIIFLLCYSWQGSIALALALLLDRLLDALRLRHVKGNRAWGGFLFAENMYVFYLNEIYSFFLISME